LGKKRGGRIPIICSGEKGRGLESTTEKSTHLEKKRSVSCVKKQATSRRTKWKFKLIDGDRQPHLISLGIGTRRANMEKMRMLGRTTGGQSPVRAGKVPPREKEK